MSEVFIVGGGTAGHVLPGIAIGKELVARGAAPSDIHFVGSERGVEATIVPNAGFPLTLLPGRGIQRRMTTDNIGALLGLLRAFVSSFSLLREHRPGIVVALGGYASVPAGVGAILLRIPVVVAEQNAVPGLANTIIGKFAKACAVSYEGTDLPRTVWTGNPVRPEILDVANGVNTRGEARALLGVAENATMIVVFGGSLGARTINNAVVDALATLAARLGEDRVGEDRTEKNGTGLVIRHIIGKRDFEDVTSRVSHDLLTGLTYTPIEYEDDMASVYAACDLVVCRAGATSCAELAVTGTPAVLIPLPGAPGDHQTANARALERPGGAEIIADADFDAASFIDVVTRLIAEPETLRTMREAARSVGRPDAASAVVDVVEEHQP